MKKTIFSLILAFIITNPLLADWIDELDGFKWGQTPEQIREYENRNIKSDSTGGQDKDYVLVFDDPNYYIWYYFRYQKLIYKGIQICPPSKNKEIVLNTFDIIANNLDEKYGKRKKGKWESIYAKSFYWKNNDKYIILRMYEIFDEISLNIIISNTYKDKI